MRPTSLRRCFTFALAFAFGALPVAHAVEVADYRFQDNFASSIGAAPALQPFEPVGTFVDVLVDGQSVRGWSYPVRAGLALETTGLISDVEYSIVMLLRVDDVGGYTKLVDFSGLTLDDGLYYLTDSLVFYPEVEPNTGGVFDDVFHQLVLTRAADGTMVGYVDGVQKFTLIDSDAAGVVLDGQLAFLRDDAVTSGEEGPGVVARLRIFNHVLTPAEVQRLQRLATGLFRDGFEG